MLRAIVVKEVIKHKGQKIKLLVYQQGRKRSQIRSKRGKERDIDGEGEKERENTTSQQRT